MKDILLLGCMILLIIGGGGHAMRVPLSLADITLGSDAIVYGTINDRQYFSAKELTVDPRARCTIQDKGAYGLTCVQGIGKINGQPLNSPKLIRFTELTEDEYFCTEDGAKAGVTFENTSETEPLVCLRYFGPEVNPDAPALGAYRKNKF